MPLKLLLVHNYYQQRGGEDESFEAEARLLETNGHEVLRYTVHNDAIDEMSRVRAVAQAFWNRTAYDDVRGLIRRERPALLHCNNTFPQLSPAVYFAARDEGLPIVQNLRNYRLRCVNGLFYRDGQVCEACLRSPVAWRGVVRRCYRESRAASAVTAGVMAAYGGLRRWSDQVAVYVTLTEFARTKFIEAGLPADRIIQKPNFLGTHPAVGDGRGNYALFVGRLSAEKGIGTLLRAWRTLGAEIPLKIVGDGPLSPQVDDAAAELPGVAWLGRRPLDDVFELMGRARMVVFPSEWYETFGRVAMEAFATGTPVIASRIGAIEEVVEHGRTGLHFTPGDADDLARRVRWSLQHDEAWQTMRTAARATFDACYTAERNYEQLMAIYTRALRSPEDTASALPVAATADASSIDDTPAFLPTHQSD